MPQERRREGKKSQGRKVIAKRAKHERYRLYRYIANRVKRVTRHLKRFPGDSAAVRYLGLLKDGTIVSKPKSYGGGK